MTTTLTERDKKILYIVALVVVFFIAFKGMVIPSINKYKEAKCTNDSLVQQQENMKAEIAKIGAYKKDLSIANKNYKKTSQKIFENYKEPDMDETITKMLLDSELAPTSFNITDISKVKITPYTPKKKDSQTTSEGGVVASKDSLITASNIQVVASGTEENVLKAMMLFDSTSGIHIQDIDITLAGDNSTFKATISMIVGDNVD